jgi:Protein of unknown function (DUF3800)
MCALIIDQPCPAKYRSMIFCDESSQTEKFFVLGALYFIVKAEVDHKAQVALIEAQLRELKERYGLFGRAKWEKVPPAGQENKLEGYKRLIRWFQATRDMRFKCMVVHTTKYPLDNRERWQGDPLIGYLKYYYTFLCTIMSKYPGHFHDITIDNYTFREDNGSQKLRDTVEGRYRNKNTSVSRLYRNCDLRTGNEEDSNLLQLIDLLTPMRFAATQTDDESEALELTRSQYRAIPAQVTTRRYMQVPAFKRSVDELIRRGLI